MGSSCIFSISSFPKYVFISVKPSVCTVLILPHCILWSLIITQTSSVGAGFHHRWPGTHFSSNVAIFKAKLFWRHLLQDIIFCFWVLSEEWILTSIKKKCNLFRMHFWNKFKDFAKIDYFSRQFAMNKSISKVIWKQIGQLVITNINNSQISRALY